MPLPRIIYVAVCNDCLYGPKLVGGPIGVQADINEDVRKHKKDWSHQGHVRVYVYGRMAEKEDHLKDNGGYCIMCFNKWPCEGSKSC